MVQGGHLTRALLPASLRLLWAPSRRIEITDKKSRKDTGAVCTSQRSHEVGVNVSCRKQRLSASVVAVLLAAHGDEIITSDPKDLRSLCEAAQLQVDLIVI